MRKTLLALILFCFLACPSHAQTFLGFMGQPTSAACSETLGSETNTTTTCTANPDASEADATTGWSANATIDSVENAQLGTYGLEAIADASGEGTSYALTGLSLSVGTTYKISYYIKHADDAAGAWLCGGGSGTGQNNSPYKYPEIENTDTTYALQELYFTYNAQQDWLTCEESDTDDGTIYIDNLSVKEVTNFCLGTELYTITDAGSITNEADDATDWSVSNATMSSVTAAAENSACVGADDPYGYCTGSGTGDFTVYNGTYALKFAASAASGVVYLDLSSLLTDSTDYFISYYVYHPGAPDDSGLIGQSSTGAAASANGSQFQITSSDPGEAWAKHGHSFHYTTGSNYTYLKVYEFGANNDAVVYIDAITIKEIE